MKFIIFYVIALTFYLTTVAILGFKAADTRNHPEKYADPELEARGDYLIQTKRYCRFFKSLSHQYSMVGMLIAFVILGGIGLFISFLNNAVFIGERTSLQVDAATFSMLGGMFLSFILGLAIIPLLIKTPFFDVLLRDMFNVWGRPAIARRAYTIFLVLFILLAPFTIQPATYYYCYDEEGIYYSEYFEFRESVLRYEDIEAVNIYIEHNNSGKITQATYEIVFNGKTKNVNRPNQGAKSYSENIRTIHQYIRQTDCAINVTPLTEQDKREFEERLSEDKLEILYYLFDES